MPDILLTTINARYIHSALGLRYLYANLGPLKQRASIREFTAEQRPIDIAEAVLDAAPCIVGFGVYIWNVEQTTRTVALLKALRPDVVVVLGGPEVSHEWTAQRVVQLADYVITGTADLRFRDLCAAVLSGQPPPAKIINAGPVALEHLTLPYREYTDEDIAHRLIYVEASRGCPFKCAFCLSALDRTARPFDRDRFLQEIDTLYARGARRFKFVDRTFNLGNQQSTAILQFFLDRLDDELSLHFEVIPDRLPEALRTALARFPPGTLQLEIGIQSFDPAVQSIIGRRQDNDAARANIAWLRANTHAHLHTDLICGLPGEDLAGFARGFETLIALDPQEVQVGILKRLRGTPLTALAADYGMVFNPDPPYNVVATDRLDFAALQRLNRFARYWDLIGNSGRFPQTRRLILGDAPFARFLSLSDWLFQSTGQTHRIALHRLFDLLHHGLIKILGIGAEAAGAALSADYRNGGHNPRREFAPTDEQTRLPGIAPGRRRRALRQVRSALRSP